MSRTIRVPLAVDAQVRVRLGPFMLPMRALALAALAAPGAWLLLTVDPLPVGWRMSGALFVLMLAASCGIPTREGVWLGTWQLYRHAWRLMPSLVTAGRPRRARVTAAGDTVEVRRVREPLALPGPLARLGAWSRIPEVAVVAPGIIRLRPGGARAVLMLSGPPVSVASPSYLAWCEQVTRWALGAERPVQLLTAMTHFDGERARLAFDRRTSGWPRTPLLDIERGLAEEVAERTLGLRHYVVFAPGLAGADGIPPLSRITRAGRAVEASDDDAERVLRTAVRLAPGLGVDVAVPDRDDLAALLSRTLTAVPEAMTGDGVLRIGDQHHVVLTMTQLPPAIEVGTVVEAMMRTRTRGTASLHVLPVADTVARRILHRRTSMLRYAARKGGDEIETAVALEETSAVVAAMAQRKLRPCRVALTLSVAHAERSQALEAAERLAGLLTGCGFGLTAATSPGFLPALALVPGGPPLGRSLQLTSDGVALRMLPALGTPFSDVRSPLAGISVNTGSPAYFSVWTAPNHNLVVVGSSGAGKSVAAKALLTRHVMEGVGAVVIDPDSEYRPVMLAVGGEHFELGAGSSLNPLAAGLDAPPDTAAGLVLPILSVMAGDEKGVRDGRPIRRLPDEDQGWLHAELAAFYSRRPSRGPGDEPVMSDLVDHLDTEGRARVLTAHQDERCRVITARLRRYTQGNRAEVFDRPSTFAVGTRPVAIGLRAFAMSYGADLTPALAVVLTGILGVVGRTGRLLVVVDEAHRVTGDPDAGEVLGQLVRQARKHGAGVWMCSQRVEDFVRTDLGRTLAATAASKLVLGTEEAVLEEAVEVFRLQPEETRAISPMRQGRGVLLSGSERTVVDVLAGPAILALAATTPPAAARPVSPAG